jgi:hypothetical protein
MMGRVRDSGKKDFEWFLFNILDMRYRNLNGF